MSLLEDLVDDPEVELGRPVPTPDATAKARPAATRPTAHRGRSAIEMMRSASGRLRRASAPVRTASARVLRVVTPIGWTAIAGAVVLFVVSRWTGWQELSVAAVALAVAVVVSALFVVGRARYQVELDLRSQRVMVGERASGRMLVRNKAGRRSLPIRMELPVGSAVATVAVPRLAKDDVHEELFIVPTNRRAVLPVGPARSVRGDGLGILRRVVRWTEPEELFVHPRTVPLHGTNPGFIKDLEGQATKELSNNDVSFHALRGYVPGDDRRYIHWKTSARTGVLMVRQFEETRRSHLAVALSTDIGEYASESEFELAMSACASLGVQSFKEERALTVLPGSRSLKAPTARTLLDLLSGVETSQGSGGVVAVARHAAAAVPDVSIAIVICGAVPTPADLRQATAAFAVGVRVIAIRLVEGAAVTIRRIGAVPVVTVGSLDDLGRALRAVRA